MKVVTYEQKRIEKIIKQFDVASTVPAWIFANHTCEGCYWGIDEDNKGDINTQSVVIAKSGDTKYTFHETCFECEKVKRWIR